MARSNIKAVFENDVQTVWNVITDVKNYIWRTDLSKTEIISDKQFIEYTKNGYATTFTITLFEPYKRWEFDVENSNIKGHWIGIFTQKGEKTEIDFTEDVTAKKVLMKPFVKAYLKKQQARYVKDLARKLKGFNWIAADHIYKKRASFVLIAASTIHDKSMTKETLDIYLKLVYENSCYEHDHIKKAVSWALREIGKTDFEYAEKVLLTAYDLLASGNKVQIWIAKDVIKELETVVKVKERKRLITSNSKMGRER